MRAWELPAPVCLRVSLTQLTLREQASALVWPAQQELFRAQPGRRRSSFPALPWRSLWCGRRMSWLALVARPGAAVRGAGPQLVQAKMARVRAVLPFAQSWRVQSLATAEELATQEQNWPW